jgi:hypothetical protein
MTPARGQVRERQEDKGTDLRARSCAQKAHTQPPQWCLGMPWMNITSPDIMFQSHLLILFKFFILARMGHGRFADAVMTRVNNTM